MNSRFVGIVLLVIGVALAAWGYDVYDSAGSHVTRALNGEAPMEAWVGMVAGAILIGIGVSRLK